MRQTTTNLQKITEGPVIDYPIALEFADKQNSVIWPWHEFDLEKDIQDILVNLTEAEKHGVLTVLKLFTHYELAVGDEYWGGVVKENFPRFDIGVMADCFSYFETNIHARFYNRINELLHINTPEFYDSWKEDKVLKERMDFISSHLCPDNLLLSLATFAMIEGAVLYSSFAFLKHFQSRGKNLLKNLVAGINSSARDENIHHEAGSWLFRQLKTEEFLTPEEEEFLHEQIQESAKAIREHEHQIVDMIFEKGTIKGITAHQMKVFVDSRINLCLNNLGYSPIFGENTNTIAEWFYDGIGGTSVIHDFFDRTGSNYHRKWKENLLTWS